LIERATAKLVRRLLRYQARQRAALTAIIGSSTAWPAQVPIQTAASVNSPDVHRFIHDLRATHLFIFGTSIVSAATLQFGTALNLHTGLSPYYRGSDAEFWPIHLDDLVHLGVTIHACTPALDGGALYAHIARQLATGEMLTPIPQDAIGRSYRFGDRTFIHDLTMAARVSTGRVRRLIAQKLALPFP